MKFNKLGKHTLTVYGQLYFVKNETEMQNFAGEINILFSGLLMLQLFADICKVYADYYFHCVDSANMLSCEVLRVARETSSLPSDITTPKAIDFLENLTIDTFMLSLILMGKSTSSC